METAGEGGAWGIALLAGYLVNNKENLNLANFMRANLYASVGVLKIGNDILFKEENVNVDRITGHGGLFKTKGVGQRILAAALNSPISVMETAGEGGAWGIALLASYLVNNNQKDSLANFLDKNVFAGNTGVEIAPTPEDVEGFNKYIENYKTGLGIEAAAVKYKKES
jgi:sugar (pentulose or hexulose) kinase